MIETVLIASLSVAAPALVNSAVNFAVDKSIDLAGGVLGNAAYDQCKSFVARFRPVNHDLERAMIAAARLVKKDLVPRHPNQVDPARKYLEDLFGRLEAFLSPETPADRCPQCRLAANPNDFVPAYLTGDPDDLVACIGVLMEPVAAQYPNVDRDGVHQTVGNRLFYAMNEVLKEPQHERAQTAFLREMLFSMQRQFADASPLDAEAVAAQVVARMKTEMHQRVQLAEEDRQKIDDLVQRVLRVESLITRIFGQKAGALITRPKPLKLQGARRLGFAHRLSREVYGREHDLEWLHGFLDEDAPVAWAVVYGEGGMGKSRLALELLDQTEGSWVGGFVHRQPGQPLFGAQGLSGFDPQDDTLFIIDYAQASSESLSTAIAYIAENPPANGSRIRFLLLERYWGPGFQYVKHLTGRDAVDATRFRAEEPAGYARRLEPLNHEPFLDSFGDAFHSLAGRDLTPEERDAAKAVFASNEFTLRRRRLPLYAGLCAMKAHHDGFADIEEWRADEIENYVLLRESKQWETHNAQQADVNALVLATMMGGISTALRKIIDDDKWAGLPQNWAVAHRIGGAPDQAQTQMEVEPLEPDPVGEVLVRRRLKGDLYHQDDATACGNATRAMFRHVIKTLKGGQDVP